MTLAVAQARHGSNQTWTNPIVGAVLVKHNQILAQGYHHRFGQAHAEIDTLNQLDDVAQAQGATMYVTLEPCSHYGKTPPCARKLVAVGIARVVIGQRDPNPLVAGKGIAILEAAGIAVTVLDQTEGLNPTYNFYYHHRRPFVTLKMAVSADGKLNAATAQRTRLTGELAGHDSQALRACQQAILIGERTLTIDQPALTVRDQKLAVAPRRVVVVNAADQLDLTNRFFQDTTPVWLLSRQPSHRTWPDFVTVTAGLVDQVVTYVAPTLLGGQALPAVSGAGGKQLPLRLTDTQVLGPDVRLTFRRVS